MSLLDTSYAGRLRAKNFLMRSPFELTSRILGLEQPHYELMTKKCSACSQRSSLVVMFCTRRPQRRLQEAEEQIRDALAFDGEGHTC